MNDPLPRGARPVNIVVGLADLLHFTKCADIEELSANVYDNSDVDTWVDEYEGGVEVSTTAGAIDLPYPFTTGEFQEVLDEVEVDYLRRCE